MSNYGLVERKENWEGFLIPDLPEGIPGNYLLSPPSCSWGLYQLHGNPPVTWLKCYMICR